MLGNILPGPVYSRVLAMRFSRDSRFGIIIYLLALAVPRTRASCPPEGLEPLSDSAGLGLLGYRPGTAARRSLFKDLADVFISRAWLTQ